MGRFAGILTCTFRSHISSAHGRGSNPPGITVAEARLAINTAHTMIVFLMELLHTKKFR
ncbi:abortive infection family protein [Klebsiella aerogenes]|uniref:abortive infection family protein n=1 Tax=Klebsiella aerogenes TaxID=548 RepID=UPI002DB60AB6|nr:abortive infection family protein [Klebsiella aerogenes]MEB5696503.1 abortive infection family protein [Klebsiella aerogenes]